MRQEIIRLIRGQAGRSRDDRRGLAGPGEGTRMRKRTMCGLRTGMPALSPAKVLLSLVFLLLASCVPPGEPLIGPIAPPPPGMARLVIYRPLEIYTTQAMPLLYLNGAPAGVTQNGGV